MSPHDQLSAIQTKIVECFASKPRSAQEKSDFEFALGQAIDKTTQDLLNMDRYNYSIWRNKMAENLQIVLENLEKSDND